MQWSSNASIGSTASIAAVAHPVAPVAHILAAHASGGAQIVATKCGAPPTPPIRRPSPFARRPATSSSLSRQQLVSVFVTARTQVEQELSTGTVHRFVYSRCWFAICHAHAHAQRLLHLMAICSRWAARRFTSCKFVAYSLSRTTPPTPPPKSRGMRNA